MKVIFISFKISPVENCFYGFVEEDIILSSPERPIPAVDDLNEEDFIPSTPVVPSTQKRTRKLVSKHHLDKDGFIGILYYLVVKFVLISYINLFCFIQLPLRNLKCAVKQEILILMWVWKTRRKRREARMKYLSKLKVL